ncbi:hypothetical protein NTE_00868 [Candidatus Nitrososphaera evergladensis SR1]|uniref:Uncharacterized protein n=1 Tax=Candidatus Nitrososphaera evergladensis SR1 TaxID=1459636 RepID=A0A075MUD0_9ARCH|nr:hypothetical protein NTE_00868 [Candidatus Nitrososphaera evergladensis SR1]
MLLLFDAICMICMKSEMCRYAHICKLYDDNSATCHSDEEASGYCGAYDDFDNYKPVFMPKLEKKLFTR